MVLAIFKSLRVTSVAIIQLQSNIAIVRNMGKKQLKIVTAAKPYNTSYQHDYILQCFWSKGDIVGFNERFINSDNFCKYIMLLPSISLIKRTVVIFI